MSARAYLGAVSAAVQSQLNGTVASLEDLHNQAFADLTTLLDAGYDVTGFKAQLDQLGQQISLLHADITTMQNDDAKTIGAWRARADAVEKSLRAVLNTIGSERMAAPERAQLRGLLWAAGVLAAATAVGAWVYTHRARARRRRR